MRGSRRCRTARAVIVAAVVVVAAADDDVGGGGAAAAGVGVFRVLRLRLDSPPGVSTEGLGEVVVDRAGENAERRVVLGLDGFPRGVAQSLGKVVIHRFCHEKSTIGISKLDLWLYHDCNICTKSIIYCIHILYMIYIQ